MDDLLHYRELANLFEYPDSDYPQKVQQLIATLDKAYPEPCLTLRRFLELLPDQELTAMQELFTRSFDVQAVTTLDLGYVLFGDDYKRGELLANLNREHRQVNNDCGCELADNLPNILRLLPKIEDQNLTHELVQEIVGPALKSMLGEFSPARIAKREESYRKHYKTLIDTPSTDQDVKTLYKYALSALRAILNQDFILVERERPESTNDFLKSVLREHEIEEGMDKCGSTNCS